MPTPDDQQAVQLESARADASFWETLRDTHAERAEGNKAVALTLAEGIAASEAAAADAAAKARAAAERLARVERGEAVGGIGKPMTHKKLAKALGWTPSDFRHAERLAEIGEDGLAELMTEIRKRHDRAEKAASRAILRRQRST